MRPSLKSIIWFLLRGFIGISILVVLFSRINLYDFLDIIRSTNTRILSLAFFLSLFSHILCLLRWQIILKALEIDTSFRILLSSFSAGLFFNLILPSVMGGDILRIADLSHRIKRIKEVVGSVLLDRLSGYIALDLLVILAMLFSYKYKMVPRRELFLIILLFSLLLFFILFILFSKTLYIQLNKVLNLKKNRFFVSLSELHDCIYYFKKEKTAILKIIFISFFVQILNCLAYFAIALSLGRVIHLIYFFLFIPMVSVIMSLPFSIAGLGLREAGTVLLFSKIGIEESFSMAVSLTSFVFFIVISCLGGIVYVFTLHTGRLQHPKKF